MGSLGYRKIIAYIAHNLTRQRWAVWAIVERLPKLPIRAWRLGGMGAFWRVGLPIAKRLISPGFERFIGYIVILCIF
jgi:hypothetical protein